MNNEEDFMNNNDQEFNRRPKNKVIYEDELALSLGNIRQCKPRLNPPPLENYNYDHHHQELQLLPESISMQVLIPQTPPKSRFQLPPICVTTPYMTSQYDHQQHQYSCSSVAGGSTVVGAGPSKQQQARTTRPVRSRRNPTQSLRERKSEIVPAPFTWATDRRAKVHSLNNLLSRKIYTINGEVQCKRCERQYEIEYHLEEKFVEIGSFIAENKSIMHDRAPSNWMNPVIPKCKFCEQENSAKPIISPKKKNINWLFLLLGQMLGCCTLEQLKYFCKHTKNHRTGAKDRVLYLTYLGLCKQLDPEGPFDR